MARREALSSASRFPKKPLGPGYGLPGWMMVSLDDRSGNRIASTGTSRATGS